MALEHWLAIAGIAVAAAMGVSGGLIGWMFSVANNLTAIKGNTEHLATEIDNVAKNTKEQFKEMSVDNRYIRGKVDEHSEKFDDHAKQIAGVRMDVLKLEASIRNPPHPTPQHP